jgi:hypothetical protein
MVSGDEEAGAYAYNVATMEDGGGPEDQEARPIGPRMAEALEYIRTHPGSCKANVFRGTGVRRSTDGTDPSPMATGGRGTPDGKDAVYRAEAAG